MLNNIVTAKKGIINASGSQCFFNSIIQMLNKIDDFRHYIRCYNNRNKQILTIKGIFNRLYDNDKSYVNFASKIQKISTTDPDNCLLGDMDLTDIQVGQQDASEVLDGLLNYLDNNDNIRYKLFKKTIAYNSIEIKKCIDNNNKIIHTPLYITSDETTVIQLGVDISLDKMIRNYSVVTEEFDARDPYAPCKFQGFDGKFKKEVLIRVNNNNKWIILHIKRFKTVKDAQGRRVYDENGKIIVQKIYSNIKLNHQIYLQDEMSHPVEYKVIGSVIHLGQAGGGHYIYTDLVQNPNDKDFVKIGSVYDDSTVYPDHEKYEKVNKKGTDLLEKNAYLILCKRVL